MKKWKSVNIENANYIGIIEIDKGGVFTIVKTDKYLVFGGVCNIGMLQSGYMFIDTYLSDDTNLQELVADIETYYRDGKEYCSHIVCNERM